MRILSRPMFRYGGPIKEGVMHGMKNGGRAALVGNPVFPKDSSGRAHHGYNFLVQGGLRALPWLQRMGSRYIAPLFRKQVGTKMTPGTSIVRKLPPGTAGRNLPQNVTRVPKQGPSLPEYAPTWLGKDPIVRGVGWAGSKVPVKGAWNFATSPSSLVIGGVTWYMWPDGTPRKTPPPQGRETGVPGGGDPGMTYTKPPVTKTPEELAAEAKAARTKKLNKYLDTMGYDKAKKTAIGDALIDASAIVQQGTEEAGSLKHANWSKMINQAIQATSQRLKKPEQIREAVGLMMTKADIQKDMNADEKALAKLLTSKKIQKLNKELEGNSFRENLIAITQKMPGQAGFDAAAQVTEGVDFKGNLINATDWTESLKKMQEDPTSTGLNEKQLIKLYAEKEIAGKGYEDGDYTVGNNLVTIKDDIVVAVE